MSQEEVEDFFKKHPLNSCGIFRKDQLEVQEVPFRKVKFPGVLALTVAGLIGISFPAIAQIPAKTPVEKTQQESQNYPLLQPQYSQNKTIIGRVFGKEGSSEIPGASIILKGFKIGTSTNSQGEFELRIPDEITQNPVTVIFSMIGYKSLERTFYQTQFPVDVKEIFLETNIDVMGEYIVIPPKKNLWRQFKGIFQKEKAISCSDKNHNHT